MVHQIAKLKSSAAIWGLCCYMGNDFKVCTFISLHYTVCNVCLVPREPL